MPNKAGEAWLETTLLGTSPESRLMPTLNTRVLDRVMARRRRH